MTETSQKSRLADTTIWVARATRFVTAFARALFPHRKMALEVPARFCVDMPGHDDRMPGGILIPDHHVIDTPKSSAQDLSESLT